MTAKIPKHWKIKKLGEIANISSGTTPFRKNPLFYDNADIPWVKTTDLNNSYITTTEEKVSMYALNNTSLRLYPTNTVLVAMYGGFNQIGRTGKLAMEATINQALSALVLKNDDVNSDYLLFWLNANVEKWKRFAGSSRKDPNINGKDVAEFSILIPPLEEQEKIAEILLSCDKAIRLTTQIITQLKQRNQGLAQQLLTGEKRVKGFEKSVWKSYSISEICKIGRGRVISAKYISENKGIYPVYSSQTQNEGVFGKINTYDFEGEYITWTTDGVNAGTVSFREGKFNCTNVCGTLKVIDVNNFSHKFLAYKLATIAFQYVSYTLANPKLMNNTMGDIIIDLPEITEQNAIAQILDTAHQELKLYEQKLQLLQAQKKTLMQKLLTGEVLTIK